MAIAKVVYRDMDRAGYGALLDLPARTPVIKLLQYVRDEAHRFAQHYHHLLRSKTLLDG